MTGSRNSPLGRTGSAMESGFCWARSRFAAHKRRPPGSAPGPPLRRSYMTSDVLTG